MKVFSYTPDGHDRHCREGCAVEDSNGERWLDTYWSMCDFEAHVLTDTERESAYLRFDTRDFREVRSPLDSLIAPQEWLDRSSADRGTIPSQHGLRMRWFIRLGSTPDRAMRIANATQKVTEAAARLRAATYALQRAEADLAELLEEGD